jgi:hypothetical protein
MASWSDPCQESNKHRNHLVKQGGKHRSTASKPSIAGQRSRIGQKAVTRLYISLTNHYHW